MEKNTLNTLALFAMIYIANSQNRSHLLQPLDTRKVQQSSLISRKVTQFNAQRSISATTPMKLDLRSLAKGIYLVKIIAGEETYIRRILRGTK